MIIALKKEELEWLAKKGKKRQGAGKNPTVYKKKNKPYSNNKNSSSVVVKITGGAKDSESSKEHANYISRNGKLDIFDEDGIKISKEIVNEELDSDIEIQNKNSRRIEKTKKTYQIMFSLKGKTDPEKLKKIVHEVAKENFKNYKFYYAVHEDTDNTHVHMIVSKQPKIMQKRLDIRKSKLNKIKSDYARIASQNGLNATFSSISERDKKENRESLAKKREHANIYKLVDFGYEKFKFRENGKPSFYIIVENKNGTLKDHFSIGLADEIDSKNIKIGDYIKIKKEQDSTVEGTRFKKSIWNLEKVENPFKYQFENIVVQDFGEAQYRFDKRGKPSYYLLYKDENGKIQEKWDIRLKKIIENNHLKTNDRIKIDLKNLYIQNTSEEKIQSFKQEVQEKSEKDKKEATAGRLKL
ncbi:relaxase/mobilization nuclease domain-containing protein [Actinobacillus delphinicola]|uniref:relaxase/mobilization nuclease domain-containing protein n=1 Tax=Actinobacillus delphinicola TaxID=51161 RepID=UPI0024432DBD|nr:relaxase/mobilization nuclease domain-containing protein [Actinobacillus delphinicola]